MPGSCSSTQLLAAALVLLLCALLRASLRLHAARRAAQRRAPSPPPRLPRPPPPPSADGALLPPPMPPPPLQFAGEAAELQGNLTAAIIAPQLRNGTLILTYADAGHADFARNWASNLLAAGVTRFLIAALDDRLPPMLAAGGTPHFRANTTLTAEDLRWQPGAPMLHLVPRVKIELILKALQLGVAVLFSDTDVVWLKDPLPYMGSFPDAAVLVSTDDPTWPLTDHGLDVRRGTLSACTGIMLFRQWALNFTEHWRRWPRQYHTGVLYDQPSFMQLCAEGHPPGGWRPVPGGPGYFPAWGGRILLGVLPAYVFLNGHTFFIQGLHRHPRFAHQPPIAVHASFASFGAAGKRQRFREAMLWHDPPDYHSPPGGLLAIEVDLPASLLQGFSAGPHVRHGFEEDPEPVARHFRLVHHQLRQIRVALAAAEAAGRVVVLPKLWCGYDRAFSPHEGTFPGSNFTIPFPCPLDLVLDVGQLERFTRWPGGGFREHSFFANPRTPAAVAADAAPVSAARLQRGGGVNSRGMRAVARELRRNRVLRLTRDAVAGWRDPPDAAEAETFELRSRGLVTNWCCVQLHKRPGHIWYDMWWDRVPHRDVVGRSWTTPWLPRPGDT
eukprot:TRINITY_DN20445_c0_g1_i3.p1 TRINITY_DN20445_c0_g1~~TRINITY_DN20445_c0_g1_i3.p1  ORF type:complete len:637 (+),score=132.90 TRINITY_DN20445_c0_g1_i3:73-1911(+)